MKTSAWIEKSAYCSLMLLLASYVVSAAESEAIKSPAGSVESESVELAQAFDSPISDLVLVASTRNYPRILGRVLDFNRFVGCTCCVNGQVPNIPTSLVQPSQFVATWVFVHGNQIPPEEAIKRGLAVYQRLRNCVPNDGPIRFVIWSWPSERNTNRVADAFLKKERTDVESFLLGSYLATITCDCPIRIISYSFGARIVSGGLHLASGGQLEGYCLRQRNAPVAPYRVAFMAAAVDSVGFTPAGRYRHALDNVEQLLLMNNSRDPALRFFWLLDSSKPVALGRSGLEVRPRHVRVTQYDWADYIGKDHSLWRYLDRPFVTGKVSAMLR